MRKLPVYTLLLLFVSGVSSGQTTTVMRSFTFTYNQCNKWDAVPAGYSYLAISDVRDALAQFGGYGALAYGHIHASTDPADNLGLVYEPSTPRITPKTTDQQIDEYIRRIYVTKIVHNGACALDMGESECVGLFMLPSNSFGGLARRGEFARVQCTDVPKPRPDQASCKLLTPQVTVDFGGAPVGKAVTRAATLNISCSAPDTRVGATVVWPDATSTNSAYVTFSNGDKVTARLCPGTGGPACSPFPAHLRASDFPASLEITYTLTSPGVTTRVGSLMLSYE
ncbi:hypothetical protein V0242_09260 [Aeromonas hydrophila]|uniref:hypothetical protein n=1 Tax=Aeromonas hydrophila TaxID=644 RepID=UPI002ED1062A|nr:hypothetical protein V0242_09260 [Aeromonas hydrophila]